VNYSGGPAFKCRPGGLVGLECGGTSRGFEASCLLHDLDSSDGNRGKSPKKEPESGWYFVCCRTDCGFAGGNRSPVWLLHSFNDWRSPVVDPKASSNLDLPLTFELQL
jgi:hypothetical protein